MKLSIFDLFKIGIGPSSSHTMGPMLAVFQFMELCETEKLISKIERLSISIHGSLAWTGKGHGTDKAILLGLSGYIPQTINPSNSDIIVNSIIENEIINYKKNKIKFNLKKDLVFDYQKLFDFHSNGIQIKAFNNNKKEIINKLYFSVGGGFVVSSDEINQPQILEKEVPFEFNSGKELLKISVEKAITISEIIRKNELAINPKVDLSIEIKKIWTTMQECIERGLTIKKILPGKLNVKRRAPKLYESLLSEGKPNQINLMDWVNVWAMSVNEENASGGKIVTAPTNGAAGIIPSVLKYYNEFIEKGNNKNIENFLLTAGAIGLLYKNNASISGAEVGCQGEVGVACSMAAAGLAAAMGGTSQQIENAAEIGMEHNLGLTCDPVGGLVQIPCIERNAMGAVKAINAARIALKETGEHMVSLDQVIQTMFETGKDMQSKYKETSQGGLAVNVVEC